MIELWLVAVRDHPERPAAVQRMVLWSLALRLDWATGCGYASSAQLAGDADACERTVRYATRWGRDHGLLVMTRRGHYVSADRRVASEWRLTQPATDCLLESQPANGSRPNRQTETSQPAAGAPPSVPRSSRPRSSARGAANAAAPPRRAENQNHGHPVAITKVCGRCGGNHDRSECTA